MSNIAYLYNDWIDDLAAAAITITNEDSNYPETNMQDEQVALTTRTTDKSSIKIQLDLGSAKQPQAFFIGNHNFSGGTFDINSYTADDFSTGKTTVENDKSVRDLDVYHRESSAPAARRYWEFDLTNVTSGDSYYEFGRVMVYSDFTQLNEIEDFEKGRAYGFKNIVNITSYGIRWVHKLAEKIEEFELRWKARDQTYMPSELKTLFDAINGNAHPFVLIPDLSGTDCYYGYSKENTLEWTEQFGTGADAMAGAFVLRFIEAVRGKA